MRGEKLAMERLSVVRVELNMSWWVLEDQGGYDDYVHAIHEVGEYEGVRGGGLSRWEDGDEALLTKKDWVAVGGGPAHLHVNHEHGMAYVASYGAGTWSAVTLDQEGKMVRERREVFGEGCRNNTSHPHHTLTLASHVWVVDLGKETLSPLSHLLLQAVTPSITTTRPRPVSSAWRLSRLE